MKKIVKFAASLLVFAGALVSCQKETLRQELDSVVPTSFTASFEQTKLTIDGFTPKFEIGDEIGVEAGTGAPMTSAKATFQVTKINADGSANLSIKGSWSGTPVPPYYVYKGSVNTSMIPYMASMIVFNLPYMELSATSDKIDKTILFGKTDNLENGVTLLNACALLKVTVPESVKMIKVAAQNGYVSPQVNVNFANNTIMGQNNVNEFVYANATGMIAAGTYYIPFAPTQPAAPLNGLKVGYSTDGSEFIWREKAGSIAIERNKIYDLGSFADWPKPGPVGPTVADFVGTFKGSYSADWNINPNNVTNLTDQEFVLEEINEDSYNVKIVSVGGLVSGAKGTLDVNTGLLTFSKGQKIPYPNSYTLNAAAELGDDLQLQFSEDRKSLKMSNVTCAINAIAYPQMYPQITKIELTRQGGGGGDEGFAITDLTGHTYNVSCKINGTTYSGTMKAQAAQSALYLSNVFGEANGYGSSAFIKFNTETGELVFVSEGGQNNVKLPYSLSEFHTNPAIGDNILVLSADKKTITIHEDLGDMLLFYDASDNMVTVSEYIATLNE